MQPFKGCVNVALEGLRPAAWSDYDLCPKDIRLFMEMAEQGAGPHHTSCE